MALKRKRSASELVTLFNSPARSDSSVESFDFPISPSLTFPRAFATPSHLDSRTRKRFRDNRPSQEEVHQRTLQMLYSAQQQDQSMETELSSSPAPAPAVARNTQKSLHSFWNIKSAQPPVSRTASPPLHQRALSPTSCEDCAVADLTGKTIALTIKLKALWEEVKDVPVTLLEKAEHLQHLEELLDLAEQDAAENYTPAAVQNAINRARAAKNDVRNTIDAYTEELANRRRYRRRLAAAKFVIQKDDLRTVEQKLDRALELYKLANTVAHG
ncbi:hypothetical protein KHU50_008011 [Colletotrichum sp. SAR 10_65]|nr:hypothetical protein KHU50_008011 [Colletotrichum sp. SAR 10_65]KAI8175487.1 hypothetical protein K4K51_007415 [Colletotrichum sp. SAR 10_75]KAI8219150.1 hypothetical protein K4K53_008431 [Colletotrichum sp. SAR 10_77]